MTKLNQIDRDRAEVEWSQLKAEAWVVVTEEGDKSGDDPLWKKANGFFTVFLTKLESAWEFALHGINDETLAEQMLTATNFEDAAKECDELLTQYVAVGASILMTGEIRIAHAFSHNSEIYGVGVDGKLYKQFRGDWLPMSMKLSAL